MIRGRITVVLTVEAYDEHDYHRAIADLLDRLTEYASLEDCKVERLPDAS